VVSDCNHHIDSIYCLDHRSSAYGKMGGIMIHKDGRLIPNKSMQQRADAMFLKRMIRYVHPKLKRKKGK